MRSPFPIVAPIIALLIGISACTPQASPVLPQAGSVITTHDPRDTEQCTRQPALPWCRNACKVDGGRGWCA